MIHELITNIFKINSQTFNEFALKVFYFQSGQNPVYREYLNLLGVDPRSIKSVDEIPFLPIELFKTQKVLIGNNDPLIKFESSGTTGTVNAIHYVVDPEIYKMSITSGFRHSWGDCSGYVFAGLLPSYLDRPNASLVYMMDWLMETSGQERKYFYTNEYERIREPMEEAEKEGKKFFLVGVTFALLDLAEKWDGSFNGVLIETGGMKGRRKEMVREELHDILKEKMGITKTGSEYGMTELLSQAWSKGDGLYQCPPWMKVIIRDPRDPFGRQDPGETGGINVIDLANIYSCSFLATSDLGRLKRDGNFEVLGRFDNSDIRGCNLLSII